MRRLGVAGSLAVLCALGALATASGAAGRGATHGKKPQSLTFSVTFSIKEAHYSSQITTGDFDTNEADVFADSTVYHGLKIPKSGRVSEQSQATADYEHVKSVGDSPQWKKFGSGGGTTFDCKGDLVGDETQSPEFTAEPTIVDGNHGLRLEIELAKNYKVENSHGSYPGPGCHYFNDQKALQPASAEDMPGMVTAVVKIDLAKLRKLALDKTKTVPVAENPATGDFDAATRPPTDCGEPIAQCDQSLTWSGSVVFKRTA